MSGALRLFVAGSSPALPRPGGACSSYLVRAGGTALLVDIGSGALGKLREHFDFNALDGVLISHMHADHFFDLAALRQGLKYGGGPRYGKMPLLLPPNGAAALEALRHAVSPNAEADFFDRVFSIREYDPERTCRVDAIELQFARTRHYIEGYAVRVACEGESIVYSSDTAPCDGVVELARTSPFFLCEAALGLGSENGDRGHSSASEAGEMAARAGVNHLALTHYADSWDADELIAAARRSFSGSVTLATDGSELL
ncbi:MAG TPA: MBL fold metallo-hydrolase [Candidatus Cybelea sp.]|nr:MBL fold metallo-hydrolase [Candidatus Cybelea sp.]